MQFSDFNRNIDSIYSLPELEKKLSSGKQLRIKYGVDVTSPFLHIGHAVNLWTMRKMQEAGHKVVFLIGDFTTRIGDPTGKSQTRKQISREDIDKNAEEFIKQVSLILLTDKNVFEIRKNSEWFDKMPLGEFLSLLSMVTHSKLIDRDMFQNRIKDQKEIFMHELLYPLLQGYDSFMLESDLTIVGSDQLFNELMGRFYQEKFGQSPQIVATTKITAGLDGKEKQSKSLNNYISIIDSPKDKFGKIMSIPDSLITDYFKVYTEVPFEEIENITNSKTAMEAKKLLAWNVVKLYHGAIAANDEINWFKSTFSDKEVPQDAPIVLVSEAPIIEIVQKCLPNESKQSIRRLVESGAVKINGSKIESITEFIKLDGEKVMKVGKKHWFKLTK